MQNRLINHQLLSLEPNLESWKATIHTVKVNTVLIIKVSSKMVFFFLHDNSSLCVARLNSGKSNRKIPTKNR